MQHGTEKELVRMLRRPALPLACAFALLTAAAGCDSPLNPAEDVPGPEPRLSHAPDEVAVASGTFLPVNESGVRGSVSIADDGSSLTIEASAVGLDPDNKGEGEGYVSLTYDLASPVRGPEACEPGRGVGTGTEHPLSLTLLQMLIGDADSEGPFGLELWDVDSGGEGTLGPVGVHEYVPVDRIGTVSIRDLRINGGFGPEAVMACARITAH